MSEMRSEPFELRRATASDAPRISMLGTQVFLETYARNGIDDGFVREVQGSLGLPVIEALLAGPNVTFVLAERGNYLLGFAQWTRGRDHPLLPPSARAELNRLYVQEASTRRGIGKALVARVEADAANVGEQALWLTAWIGNPRALAFYPRVGYVDAGSTPYTFEGESFENRLFVKLLGR